MMISIILLIYLNQAFERYSSSAYAMALAQAFTASARDVDAVRYNPATLSMVSGNKLMAGYEYIMSGIEGLHNINVGFARQFVHGGIGMHMSQFGFSEQKEQALTLAYGLPLSDDFFTGIGGDIYLVNNARTGTHTTFGLNIGFRSQLYKKWVLGVFCHNLNSPQFGVSEFGRQHSELRAGLAYEPFQDIRSEIDISMQKQICRVHLASEFILFNIFAVRAGVKTDPTVVSAGSGIRYKIMRIDYAVEYVPELPMTHALTINFGL
jgi:hypothetical protein